jgi:hypothetical protein
MELTVDFTSLKIAVLRMNGYRVDKIREEYIAFAPQKEMPDDHFNSEIEAWRHLIATWDQQS